MSMYIGVFLAILSMITEGKEGRKEGRQEGRVERGAVIYISIIRYAMLCYAHLRSLNVQAECETGSETES